MKTLALCLSLFFLIPFHSQAQPTPDPSKGTNYQTGLCVAAVATLGLGYMAYRAIKRWCQTFLGTNLPPIDPLQLHKTNSVASTNKIPKMTLIDPVSGPRPLVIQARGNVGEPWTNLFILSMRCLNASTFEVVCSDHNGIGLETQAVPILDYYEAYVDFSIAQPPPPCQFRTMETVP